MMRAILLLLLYPCILRAQPSVLEIGDSLTIIPAPGVEFLLDTDYDYHWNTFNWGDSARFEEFLGPILDDPDANPATPSPSMWDLVILGMGHWDGTESPKGFGEVIIQPREHFDNITSIVDQIRVHSPNALIALKTTPPIELGSRLNVNVTPAWLNTVREVIEGNARFEAYRHSYFAGETLIGVDGIFDDWEYYSNTLPADEGLTPGLPHATGIGWRHDGVHLDPLFRIHQSGRVADFIRELLPVGMPVPEPTLGVWLVLFLISLRYRCRR